MFRNTGKEVIFNYISRDNHIYCLRGRLSYILFHSALLQKQYTEISKVTKEQMPYNRNHNDPAEEKEGRAGSYKNQAEVKFQEQTPQSEVFLTLFFLLNSIFVSHSLLRPWQIIVYSHK